MIGKNKKAIIWSGIDKVSSFAVNFVIQMLLARLLCPDDYAIVAMLAIFFAISQSFIDGGFPTALIQRQDCTQTDLSSAFYCNIFVGFIVYILFYIGAPYIADYYNLQKLCDVTRVYSLMLLIGSFSMVHRVVLLKDLQFKKLAYISLLTNIISAIPAIVMAYCGFGYWALVAQALISSALQGILLFYFSHWTPSLTFSFQRLKVIGPFGIKIVAVYLFHAVYNNIYTMLIGKNFSLNDLGYYDRGKSLSSIGSVGFSDFYTRALFPIQVKFQDENEMLKSYYLRSFALSCYIITPISAFLCVYSKSTVYSLLGGQWVMAWWIVSILSIGYIFYPLQAINTSLIKVKGRGGMLLSSEMLKKTLGIILAFVVITLDFKYVIYGWTATALIEFTISQIYAYRLGRFMFRGKDLLLPVAISFSLAIIIKYIIQSFTDNPYILFFVGGMIFVILYACITFKRIRRLC